MFRAEARWQLSRNAPFGSLPFSGQNVARADQGPMHARCRLNRQSEIVRIVKLAFKSIYELDDLAANGQLIAEDGGLAILSDEIVFGEFNTALARREFAFVFAVCGLFQVRCAAETAIGIDVCGEGPMACNIRVGLSRKCEQ